MHLNFKTFGQGKPLIIVHGLFGTLDNWQTLAKQFSTTYTVFVIDQRNHGRSPHTFGDYNYQVLADDLFEFMEQNWIYKAHLLGHSMGGKTVMQFAMNYTDYVEKMIIVDIAPKHYMGGHETILEALSAVPISTLTDRLMAENILLQYIKEQGTIQFLLKNLSRKKEGGFEWKMNLENIIAHYDEILADIHPHSSIETPSLFIKGSKSNYINLEDEQHIKSMFTTAKIATIEGAGHWVHADKPNDLFHLVNNFLEE